MSAAEPTHADPTISGGRWAVFDVDGTLLPRKSMERRFIAHLLRSGCLPWRNVIRQLAGFLSALFSPHPTAAMKANKRYLQGLDEDTVRAAARLFIDQKILPALSPSALQTLLACRRSGFRILLLSGSPDFLIEPLQRVLRAEACISTRPELADSRYTGGLPGMHPYGRNKCLLLCRFQEQNAVNFRDSCVFADHYSDAHHMVLFGQATAVNPGRRLRRLASRHGWRTVRWR